MKTIVFEIDKFKFYINAYQGPGRKGSLRRKPCTVLVQGKHRRDTAFHKVPAGLPQGAAEAREESLGKMAEFPAPYKEGYVPHDCKQDDFASGTLKSQGI
jgi:hypothetical protein